MIPGWRLGEVFLSTLPARGATRSAEQGAWGSVYFYPRSPRGERLNFFGDMKVGALISIHAPREGSDTRWTRSGRAKK